MFRWGIFSTAQIGCKFVIPQIQDSKNGVVAAVARRQFERAEQVARRFQIPKTYGSYEELLRDPEIDGVYIPLPNSQHVEWSLKALARGKHVLCEKPISMNASAIDLLIRARDTAGKLISEAFMVSYHPQWLKVWELLAAGAIGRLRHVQGAFAYSNDDPDNMRNQVALGGGALPDIGVYPAVSTRFATGCEPLRVRASLQRDERFGTDIYADVNADFGHFTLSFYCATQLALRQLMVFHGGQGYIELKAPFNASEYDIPELILHNQGRTEDQVFRFPAVRQYRLQCEAFVRYTQEKGAAVFTLEDSVKNQKLIDAVYRAAGRDGWETV